MKIIRNHVGVMQIEEELYVVMKFKRMSSIFVGVPRPGLFLLRKNEIIFFSKECFSMWRMPLLKLIHVKEIFQNVEESKSSPHLVCSLRVVMNYERKAPRHSSHVNSSCYDWKSFFLTLLHGNSRDQVNHMVVSPVFALSLTELLPTMGIVSHDWKSL